MNRNLALILVVLILVVGGASAALAQHDHSADSAQASTPEGQVDSMQECQKHHTEGAAAIDRAATNLARAKQLTDPEQIRAAIDSAENEIAEAKHHLSMCVMAQDGNTDHSTMDHPQHQQHKMKCMSKDSRPE